MLNMTPRSNPNTESESGKDRSSDIFMYKAPLPIYMGGGV